jgi:hypothetical protein
MVEGPAQEECSGRVRDPVARRRGGEQHRPGHHVGDHLLDEPLANLDYKLREELRAELPKIFAETGAIFVYATTEPHEALLLGGNTATLSEGRVTQFGPTSQIYRKPQDIVTARVFSDPPMNTAPAAKIGGEILIGGKIRLPAGRAAVQQPPPRHFLPDQGLETPLEIGVGSLAHSLASSLSRPLLAQSRRCFIPGAGAV